MSYVGEMQYLTIGDSTYSLPSAGGSGTVTSVGVSNATNGGLTISGSPITSSGSITIGHSNVLTSVQTTQAVYPIKIDKNGHISEYGNAVTIPSITLNGSSSTSPSFYAPTSAGTSGYVLKSNGSGAPSWIQAPTDENVKISGTTTEGTYRFTFSNSDSYPITSSLYTLTGCGFTVGASANILRVGISSQPGQIDLPNGAYTITLTTESVTNSNKTITFPNKTGTVALTSDIVDQKLQVAEVSSGTTYYPIVGTGTTAATRQYDTTGLTYQANNGIANDPSSDGAATLTLGNNKAYSSSGWKRGRLKFQNVSYYTELGASTPSANRTVLLPDATGTVALTSDIPTVPTITLNGSTTTSPSFYAPTGAGTSGQYLKSNGSGAPSWTNFPTIPSITLNGSTTTSPLFYAPISIGTNGQYLKSSGSGAPTWADFPTIPTITDTYSGTSSNGMSGKAVKSAIDALDGTISGTVGAGKTLTAFSQTDGKVSATFGDISITKSQISDFPTIPSITLNGSTTTSPSFYAPTSVGTSGYVLKSNGSGAPTWISTTATPTASTISEFDSNAKMNSTDMSSSDIDNFIAGLNTPLSNYLQLDSSNNAKIAGNFYAESSNYPIGWYDAHADTTSISNGTSYASISASAITLSAGRYMLFGSARFAGNATGYRGLCIMRGSSSLGPSQVSQQALPSASWITSLNCSCFEVVSSSTTYYLGVYQNSGGSLSTSWSFYAVRIR